MFSSHIRLKTLAIFCRSLSTMLESGVVINKAVATAGRKLGDSTCRRNIAEVADSLKRGDDISKALQRHGDYFPDLFIEMVYVAENTGALPEVLRSLADHYENLIRLKRGFVSAITPSILQLIVAIFIIAFVIFIIGMIGGQTPDNKPIDVLGWGLTGTAGALTFLGYAFGSIFAIVGSYLILSRGLAQRRFFHRTFLRIPVLGKCLRSFAIARFSWAYYLTQQAGMDVIPSLEASLRATSNGAFIGESPRICSLVIQGHELTAALAASKLFPDDYLQMVEVAETSGTVPEMLERLSPQFEDQARRSLNALAMALGWLIWALVATFIIIVIFSIVFWYLGLLNDAIKGF